MVTTLDDSTPGKRMQARLTMWLNFLLPRAGDLENYRAKHAMTPQKREMFVVVFQAGLFVVTPSGVHALMTRDRRKRLTASLRTLARALERNSSCYDLSKT
jgi:hypothetical protein